MSETEKLRQLAATLGLDGDWQGVVDALERIRTLEPDSSFGPRFAYALRALGRYEEAEAEYTRELLKSPGNAVLLEGRSAAKEKRGDLSGALDDLRAAHKVEPGDHARLAALAGLEVRAGLVEKAAAHLDEAVKLAPEHWPHRLDRGILKARAEAWKETEEDMTVVVGNIAGKPAVSEALLTAYSYRGWARLKLGRAAEALTDLDEAVQLGPRDAQALCFRAMARAARKDPRALEDFNAALEEEPEDPFALCSRGEYHLLVRGDKKAALKDFEKAIAVDPGHAAALDDYLRRAKS